MLTEEQKKLLSKLKQDKDKIIEIMKQNGKKYQSLPKKGKLRLK